MFFTDNNKAFIKNDLRFVTYSLTDQRPTESDKFMQTLKQSKDLIAFFFKRCIFCVFIYVT